MAYIVTERLRDHDREEGGEASCHTEHCQERTKLSPRQHHQPSCYDSRGDGDNQ
jgi:hypothetical protein